MDENYIKLQTCDPLYPPLLKQIHRPPKTLFCKGSLKAFENTCISVVGTRRSSNYGEFITRKIISELSVTGLCIVSGLAKGIDAIAHDAALKNDMPTIAVLGGGLKNIYPRQNENLAGRIEKNGLIITEYDNDETPQKYNFPQRNRIISGLSIATLVIEAPEKSGALITANLALEQGREVFVVPGDVDQINSIGVIKLLQKGGAYPVCSGQDIIDVLNDQSILPCFREKRNLPQKPTNISAQMLGDIRKLNPIETKIFEILPRHRGLGADQIYQRLLITAFPQIDIQKFLEAISMLELKRLVAIKDGKYYRRQNYC